MKPPKVGRGYKTFDDPQPWARQVEAQIRTCNPACGENEIIFLLRIDGELAAVGSARRQTRRPTAITIEAVATSVEHRRKGLAIEMTDRLIDWGLDLADADGENVCTVFAKTHPDNAGGRAIVGSYGFVLEEADAQWEVWKLVTAFFPTDG